MQESMKFTFNYIDSEDMGVIMINSGNGLFEETFLPTRSILETKINGRNKTYFKGVDESPLSFPLSFYIEGWKDRNNLREIARWLYQPYYKPIWFESNPEQVFYVMFEGDSRLFHNGCQNGYVTLNVRCNSPYSYSLPITHSFTVINEEKIALNNEGDITIRPKLKITQFGTDDISIKNEENGQEFILTGVDVGEVVTVDCENESIVSSLEYMNKYLFDNHNDIWLDFETGSAEFSIKGNFELEVTLEYAYIQSDKPIFF